jgi:Holliday junction DNA helicase RuvA
MYEYITGVLVAKDPTSVVIEAGGFGYRVLITTQTFDQLPVVGATAKLFIHKSFNAEQGLERLFGFAAIKERQLFLELLEVQRIGPSVAMRILSGAGMDTIVNAICSGNVQTLKRIKGIGPKMAERLVVELQEPLSKLGLLTTMSAGGASKAAPQSNLSAAARDALSALVTLGYRPGEAEKAVLKASEELEKAGAAIDTSSLLRVALRQV